LSKTNYFGTFTAAFVKLGAETVDIKLERDEASRLLGSLIRAIASTPGGKDSFRISLKWDGLALNKRRDNVSASMVP
jgi:hypothetical protein